MFFIALRLIIAFLAFASIASADHEANWFRTTPNGRHASIDASKRVDEQVTATTCLPSDSFVRVNGRQFELSGKEFVFAGWNQWEMMEAAMEAPSPPARHLPLPGREHIVRIMNEAVRTGLKVVRVWAHTITKGLEVQIAPGVWNEEALEGLDFFVSEARKRQLRIILVLADNWYPAGVDSYVAFSDSASSHQDFFTDVRAKQIFKDMIKTITLRRNTVNGMRYADDPTIFAYNLINEARCQNCPAETMGRWIEEMTTFLKSHAPNQLVGLGYEGFFHSDDPEELRKTNPGVGSDWAAREGQSWIRHSRFVDFFSIHVWPDNWTPRTLEFQAQYIQSRLEIASRFDKPFILEEFGKQVNRDEGERGFIERDRYFSSAFELAERAAREGRLSGTLFWHLYDRGVGLTSKYGIHTDESTFDLVRRHAQIMNGIGGQSNFCSPR